MLRTLLPIAVLLVGIKHKIQQEFVAKIFSRHKISKNWEPRSSVARQKTSQNQSPKIFAYLSYSTDWSRCTCLIPVSYKCFTSPCFTVMFQKIISLGNKTSDQRSARKCGAINIIAELSILNSSGASPGATKKVAALVTALLPCRQKVKVM